MANVPPHPHDLDAYCAWLNSLSWVRLSGRPYRIIHNEEKHRRELDR